MLSAVHTAFLWELFSPLLVLAVACDPNVSETMTCHFGPHRPAEGLQRLSLQDEMIISSRVETRTQRWNEDPDSTSGGEWSSSKQSVIQSCFHCTSKPAGFMHLEMLRQW